MSSDSASALAAFSAHIATLGLSPLWERKARLLPGSDCVPALWRYEELRPLLLQSTELISKKQAERRVLVMENPQLRGTSFITNSLYAGLQIILPGEVAPSHRHTPSALRFVVEGVGAYTAVDGARIPMRPGDFVVTPPWAWHDHGNLGSAPVVWLDGLDTPFAQLFGAHFRENQAGNQADNQADNKQAQAAAVEAISSPLIFRFDATRAALTALAGGLPHAAHGHTLRYTNRAHGGHAFLTMSARMQLLAKGFRGQPYRATDGTVFHVAEGHCRVDMGGSVHRLQTHDTFVVPPWESYRFEADEDCFVFSFSDRAAQEALGYWREELL